MKKKIQNKTYKCISFIIENTWLPGMDHGWGNGYVAVDETHPLFGKSYRDKIKCNVDKIPFNGNYIGLLVNSMSKDHSEVSLDIIIDVHCGLTYSNEYDKLRVTQVEPIEDVLPENKHWVFGFDTAHCDDDINNWPKEKVIEETLKLKEQLKNWK